MHLRFCVKMAHDGKEENHPLPHPSTRNSNKNNIYILYTYKERVGSQPNCAAADMAKKLSLFAASLPPTNCPCPINYAKSLRLAVAPRQPLTLLLPCPPSVCQCPHTVIDSSTWTLDCTGCFSCYRLWQIPNTYIYHPVECHF